MTSDASRSAREAFCSPSAAITLARAVIEQIKLIMVFDDCLSTHTQKKERTQVRRMIYLPSRAASASAAIALCS